MRHQYDIVSSFRVVNAVDSDLLSEIFKYATLNPSIRHYVKLEILSLVAFLNLIFFNTV